MFEPDENYEYREKIIDKLNVIKLNNDNILLLKEEDIMFIEDSNEGTTYVMDKDANLYYAQLEYGKEITRKEFRSALPKYNETSYENQKIYTAINLGMGRVLLIKSSIYEEYMKLLTTNIQYEDQYLDCYTAYCHWMDNAIMFLKK